MVVSDIEKAIEYLKEPIGKPLEVHCKAIKLAIKALEKQIAIESLYCNECGQKLDWSVEE